MQWDYLLNYRLNRAKNKGMTNSKTKPFFVHPSCLSATEGTPSDAALGCTKKALGDWIHVIDSLPDWMTKGKKPTSPKASGQSPSTAQGDNAGALDGGNFAHWLGNGFALGGLAQYGPIHIRAKLLARNPSYCLYVWAVLCRDLSKSPLMDNGMTGKFQRP